MARRSNREFFNTEQVLDKLVKSGDGAIQVRKEGKIGWFALNVVGESQRPLMG